MLRVPWQVTWRLMLRQLVHQQLPLPGWFVTLHVSRPQHTNAAQPAIQGCPASIR